MICEAGLYILKDKSVAEVHGQLVRPQGTYLVCPRVPCAYPQEKMAGKFTSNELYISSIVRITNEPHIGLDNVPVRNTTVPIHDIRFYISQESLSHSIEPQA